MLKVNKPKNSFYRFLILALLFLSLIVTNINAQKLNLLGNISVSFNLGIFRTTIIYLFLALASFITFIFILDKKLVNRNNIVTLLVCYIIYQIASLAISIARGQEITAFIATVPFYPIFALLFLKSNWDFNINVGYLLDKIKLFIYLAILVSIVALIAKRDCQFLDLLTISLLFLSFELFERKNLKVLLLIIALALISGFNLTWLCTFLFIVTVAAAYYLKHLNIRILASIIILTIIVFSVIGTIIFSTGSLARLGQFFRLPAKTRFTKAEFLRGTGRTALWEKYIYRYEGNPSEVLFGHGVGFVYTVTYRATGYVVGHLHNIFFDEFYKTGAIGLLLLVSVIVVSLKARAPTYLKVFFISLIISGQLTVMIYQGVLGIFFWMTVGMLNNTPKINKFTLTQSSLTFLTRKKHPLKIKRRP